MFSLFRRARKHTRLISLSRVLGGPLPMTVEGLLNDPKEDARQELYQLVELDKECSEVLQHFTAGRAELEEIYKNLLESGAGQWAGSTYIPCYALGEALPLYYLLHHYRSGSLTEAAVAFRLIKYYQDKGSANELMQGIPPPKRMG